MSPKKMTMSALASTTGATHVEVNPVNPRDNVSSGDETATSAVVVQGSMAMVQPQPTENIIEEVLQVDDANISLKATDGTFDPWNPDASLDELAGKLLLLLMLRSSL